MLWLYLLTIWVLECLKHSEDPSPRQRWKNLRNNGLKYNSFHTTALSAPTRMALLTGYNHHQTIWVLLAEAATTFPGYTGVRPQTITPMAEVLRQNGYNTAAVWKVPRGTTMGNFNNRTPGPLANTIGI